MSAPIKVTAATVAGLPFPPPSEALFLEMAKAALTANQEREIVRNARGRVVNLGWDDCPEEFRYCLISEAKSCYITMALAAGMKVES